MRPFSLTIYDLPADLPAVTKGLIRLTQARAALAELSSRFGEFSWPITLPATRNNARIFGVGALHSLGLNKFRAVDYPFELRCEGEIFTGTFRLTSMRGGYTGNLIGVGSSWSNQIGDKKLTDLKLAPVNYDGTQLEDILAKDCDESDIQFPLLAFGNFFAPPQLMTQRDGTQKEESLPAQALIGYPLSVDDYAPSVYFRNVLKQMFFDIGWTLTGRVLDEPRWRETLITPAGAKTAEAWPYGALLPAAGIGGYPQPEHSQYSYWDAGPGSQYENSATGFEEPGYVQINGYDVHGEIFFLPVAVPTVVSGGTRALDANAALYQAPISGVYSFSWLATLGSGHQTTAFYGVIPLTPAIVNTCQRLAIGLLVRRGGEGYSEAGVLLGTPDNNRVPSFSYIQNTGFSGGNVVSGASFSGSTTVYLEAGDTIQLTMFGRRQLVDVTEGQAFARREFVVNFQTTRFACTAFDGATQLNPAKFLPELGQRDVLRDFMLRTDSVAVADASRRIVRLLTREELSIAAGKPIDLTPLIDAESVEYTPAAGVGVGAVVFASALNSSEPLPAGLADTVRVVVGPGTTEQRIDSLFAPVALRSYQIEQSPGSNARADLPTMASAAALAQPLAEVAPDASGEAPRLLRYMGTDATLTVPFQQRRVPLARAAWSGPLRFDGVSGAVATYYPRTVERLTSGHVAKVAACITPAQYRQLTPGRGVLIQGARYSVETLSQFDIADEGATTEIQLLREV